MRSQAPYPNEDEAIAGPAWASLLPIQVAAIDESTREVPVIGPVAGTPAPEQAAPPAGERPEQQSPERSAAGTPEGNVELRPPASAGHNIQDRRGPGPSPLGGGMPQRGMRPGGMPPEAGPPRVEPSAGPAGPPRVKPPRVEPSQAGPPPVEQPRVEPPEGDEPSRDGDPGSVTAGDPPPVTGGDPAPVADGGGDQAEPAGPRTDPIPDGAAPPAPGSVASLGGGSAPDGGPGRDPAASPFGLPPGVSGPPSQVTPTPPPTPVGSHRPHRPAPGDGAAPAVSAGPAANGSGPAEIPHPTEQAPPPGPAPAPRSPEQRPGDVAELPIALWSPQAARSIRERWRDLQVQFIDDPEAAVRGAQELVTDTVRALSERLLAEQHAFDPYQGDARPDTEAMRVAMRRYREFLDRVLAL